MRAQVLPARVPLRTGNLLPNRRSHPGCITHSQLLLLAVALAWEQEAGFGRYLDFNDFVRRIFSERLEFQEAGGALMSTSTLRERLEMIGRRIEGVRHSMVVHA